MLRLASISLSSAGSPADNAATTLRLAAAGSQVLMEIAGETMAQMAAAPKQRREQPAAVAAEEEDDDDLRARLEAVRS